MVAIYANAKNALGTGTITNDPTRQAIFGTSLTGAVSLVNDLVINEGGAAELADSELHGDLTLSGVISGPGAMFKGLNGGTGIGSVGLLELANSRTAPAEA